MGISMPNQSPAAIPVGTIIGGKYRVERHVGDGGMGLVVAARHLVLNELYAIKFMHHRDLANPQAAVRFVREAQAVVKLKNNEHVARVHDVGKHETGDLYIVMELLVGLDLAEVLKKYGVLSIPDACSYILQACNALVEAHDLGIIHRDLKPANLFLTRRKDGSPCIKVLDFGISKLLANEGQETDIEMTGTRETMGSPLYMSPEQSKSARDVDSRTDIWALGAILYKLLTGKAPVGGSTAAEVSFALLEATSVPPPSEIRRDIPRALEACILRCLEKNVLRRYERVTDLMVALTPFADLPAAGSEDEDNAATVFRPAGLKRANPEMFGGTIPLSVAQLANSPPRQAPARNERSGTDVMPAYWAPASTRDDFMPRTPSALDAQTTQPLDARALQSISNERQALQRKPGFTGRVILPPASALTPGQSVGSSVPSSGTSMPPRSLHTPIPTIMPPPIPPAYPTGGYPLALAARTTLQSAAAGVPRPNALQQRKDVEPLKNAAAKERLVIASIALFTFIGGAVIALLVMRNPERLATTPNVSIVAKPSYSRPALSVSVPSMRNIPNTAASSKSTSKGAQTE